MAFSATDIHGVGEILEVRPEGDGCRVVLEIPRSLAPLVAEKGSIAVDGVSLTVHALQPDALQVFIIDYTRRHTTLGALQVGDPVHVEADMLAKHVQKLITQRVTHHA